jgi:hypothetical protein
MNVHRKELGKNAFWALKLMKFRGILGFKIHEIPQLDANKEGLSARKRREKTTHRDVKNKLQQVIFPYKKSLKIRFIRVIIPSDQRDLPFSRTTEYKKGSFSFL